MNSCNEDWSFDQVPHNFRSAAADVIRTSSMVRNELAHQHSVKPSEVPWESVTAFTLAICDRAWKIEAGSTAIPSTRDELDTEIGRILAQLGMNAVLPTDWQERTGAYVVSQLPLSYRQHYLKHLKGLLEISIHQKERIDETTQGIRKIHDEIQTQQAENADSIKANAEAISRMIEGRQGRDLE